MASPVQQGSSKSTSQFKVISGGHRQTDRQTGDMITLLSFLESRLRTAHHLHSIAHLGFHLIITFGFPLKCFLSGPKR
jgi:hypothetical protein